jgi:hypothetical protein
MNSFFIKHKQFNMKQVFMSVVVLFALLFSFVGHSEHYELTNDGAEQRCHLCQNKIDDVENKLEVYSFETSRYLAYTPVVEVLHDAPILYILPPLRGPPVNS